MSARQRIASYLFLILVVVGGGVSLDALSEPRPSAREAAVEPSAHERGRAFVFVIDSLRYETAMDSATMPELAALRAAGTFARVTPSNDAVTVPSLRAAFTGRENTKLLGFVTNFLKRRAGVRSVFTDLAASARRSAAFSDDAFTQFGEDAVSTLSNGDDGPTEVHDQNATISKALGVYATRLHDLVVMHITYTDHVAHEDGVGSPAYRERFHAADAMIAAMARSVSPDDTLVVMGDHGHDEKGRHSFGLDVPTFAVYRGVRFQRAKELGTIPIREHRYLLGWALGLPLPSDYDGPRHPDALVSLGPLPGDYAAVTSDEAGSTGADRAARRSVYLATAFDLVAAFVVWTFVAGPLAASPPAGLLGLAWASIVPRFAAPGSAGGALTGIVASLCCLGWLAARRRRVADPDSTRDEPRGDSARLVASGGAPVLVVFAALVLWGIGFLFPAIRPTLHEPAYDRIALFWTVAWLAAVALIRSSDRARYGAALLLVPVFFFFPTVYRYGSAAAMAPAWVGMSFCVVAAAGRASLPLVAPIVFFLTPFLAADASDYRFDEWALYPRDRSTVFWIVGALVAKVILLRRPGSSRWVSAVAIFLTISMVILERTRLYRLEEAFAGVVLGYAAWSFWRRTRSVGTGSFSGLGPGERMAWIAGLLTAHHALTRVEPEAYLWRDWLLAAVLLSARAVNDFVPAHSRERARAVLMFLSFMVTGWVTFAWTVHRLEWGFLYDWFSAPFVERHVAFFLPLILARYLLPLLVARLVIAEELGRETRYPSREVWLLAGWKVASLFLLTVGIAGTSSTTEIYLEGAEETAIAGVLAAGLL